MKRWHAHPLPVPDPRQPVDRWQRDLVIVAGAIAFLVIIAALAWQLNPWPVR